MSATAILENRGGGAHEGDDGSGDGGGVVASQLTVLSGAGCQVFV